MRCYFLFDGDIAGVEMLPLGLSDEDAIARAYVLTSKRKVSAAERFQASGAAQESAVRR